MKKFLWLPGLLCLLTACSAASASAPAAPEPTAMPATEALDPAPDFTLIPTAAPTRAPTLLPALTPVSTEKPGADLSNGRLRPPTITPTRISAPPLPTATRPAARETRVPILMYHHIAVPPPTADAIRLDLSVWPEHFDAQMEYFANQGYHAVKLADVYDAVTKGAPLPDKPIVFTFDDGYDDNFVNALPILQKYKFVGTFYIATGLLERPGYMTRGQVVELAKAGMDVESHSVSHPSLKARPADFIRHEVGDSKKALESMIGRPVHFFCYPSGQYDALTIQVLQEEGYLSAATTHGGAWQNAALPYEWPRVRVRGADQVGELARRVREFTAAR